MLEKLDIQVATRLEFPLSHTWPIRSFDGCRSEPVASIADKRVPETDV